MRKVPSHLNCWTGSNMLRCLSETGRAMFPFAPSLGTNPVAILPCGRIRPANRDQIGATALVAARYCYGGILEAD